MKKLPIEKIKTDVLVIGGGAAGLTAALEAKERGVDVTIISKSKVGQSGNTIIAGTGMAILAPDPDSKDAPEIFRDDIIRSGKAINDREMIDLHVAGSSKIIDKFVGKCIIIAICCPCFCHVHFAHLLSVIYRDITKKMHICIIFGKYFYILYTIMI